MSRLSRLSPRKCLATLAGAATLVTLAILASRSDDRLGAAGLKGELSGAWNTEAGVAAAPSRAGLPSSSDSPRDADRAQESDGPSSLRLLDAPGGRLGVDPLLLGLSNTIGLAPPAATSADIDLRRVIGALGLDQLGALSHGLIGVLVDEDGLVLSFDPGVVSRTWNRFVGTIAEWWNSGVRHAAEAQLQASQWAMTWFDGNRPVPPPSDAEMPKRAILLVHAGEGDGLQWTNIWDDLVPALCDAGQMAVQFEYSREESLPVAADGLGEALSALRAHGVEEVDLVAHSTGGLVVRDVLTRPSWYASRGEGSSTLPRVRRAILIGTPNHGAIPAAAPSPSPGGTRVTVESTRQVVRTQPARATTAAARTANRRDAIIRDEVKTTSLGALGPHSSAPALELEADSAYLTELNARPMPAGVAVTIIAGRSLGRLGDGTGVGPGSTALAHASSADEHVCAAEAGGWLGDGLVTLDSAMLQGVRDVVILPGGHRSLLVRCKAGVAPPAIPVILERLADGWR